MDISNEIFLDFEIILWGIEHKVNKKNSLYDRIFFILWNKLDYTDPNHLFLKVYQEQN